MLISTKPDSKGKEAALFRARQITDCRWTPIRDIPYHTKKTGLTKFPAGQENLGMIYSSPEPVDKFLFENVSFETFISALANPDSVLYNKDLGGHNNCWSYFGFVCNGLARYALNIRRRFSTKRWLTVPGMRKVYDDGCYTADQIQLCDVLYAHGKGVSHVAMVTDILKDETGEIRQIEVSEMVKPVGKRAQYDVDVFFEKFKLYAICRYDYLDETPMPDARDAEFLANGMQGLPVIAVDYGNKANYRTYETVVISAFGEGENEIEIRQGDELIETLTISGRGKINRHFNRGYYTVTHKATGETVEFAVTEPSISYTAENGYITVKADACDPDSKILYMDFREAGAATHLKTRNCYYDPRCAALAKVEELTNEEKQTGTWTRQIPEDGVHFKVYFENKYGIWTHTMVKI
ncbi:MAG: hypothetical protein IKB80_01660 [Oscillospiraceae bacterium]|nr:hypothetical protein [Oscillospiraceae bacterium]